MGQGYPESPAAEAAPFNVGAINSMRGGASAYGQEGQPAIEHIVRKTNDAGGIKSKGASLDPGEFRLSARGAASSHSATVRNSGVSPRSLRSCAQHGPSRRNSPPNCRSGSAP